MLRNLRRILGGIVFACVTLLFLDFTGILNQWLGWAAKTQLVPAILATNFVIVAVLLVLTLLFGRIYCSVICPMGVMQDGIEGIAGRFRKKNRYSYSPAITWLRYGMLLVFVIALVAHISALVVLIEPYSAFGRIAINIFAPLYRLGNNLLAFFSERLDSYAFYPTEVFVKSGIALGVSILTLGVVGFLAWRNGRTWCNTMCPVGTFLGFISKYSVFKPVIDPAKCTKCSLCSKNCKASCIDYKNFEIDHSRCVTCMNCLGKCKFDALHYTSQRPVKKTAGETVPEGEGKGMSRRGFLSVAGLFAVSNALKAQAPIADGGLAVIEDKKVPDRQTPVVPPGSLGILNIKRHCTGCQLCVSACPNNILIPTNNLKDFMQPHMSFERGYCRPECTRCSEVCPTSAIQRIDAVTKSSLQIGRAVWIKENCIVNRDDKPCTACERNCPTGAITLVLRMADEGEALKTPVVDTELCIGCGACEYVCPSRPLSAIYVEGITVHRTI